MNLKRLSIAFTLVLASFAFMTSCDDDKKKEEQMKMEAETVKKDSIAKIEVDKKAEMERMAKEERMKTEAMESSIAYKAKGTNDLTTMASALDSAELVNTFMEPGSYTIFAPSNQAFTKLPAGIMDNLMKPENKEQLKSVLQYHVVSGEISSDKLVAAIKGANGNYTFDTMTGDKLTASMSGDQIVIKDARGKKATVIQGNIVASNGVVHIIDNVLMAKK